MNDNNKVAYMLFGLIVGWTISIVQYFIIVSIMVLINYIIPGEANVWLVAMAVMLIWRNNGFVKLTTEKTIRQIEEEK